MASRTLCHPAPSPSPQTIDCWSVLPHPMGFSPAWWALTVFTQKLEEAFGEHRPFK